MSRQAHSSIRRRRVLRPRLAQRGSMACVLAVGLALSLNACKDTSAQASIDSFRARAHTPTAPATSSTTLVPSTTTTTSTLPVPTTTTSPPLTVDAGVVLSRGDNGPGVLAMQNRLVQLHYDIPKASGSFGASSVSAVMAFQKVQALPRTGQADLATFAALQTATNPAPLRPDSAPTRIEVDMGRQVLFLYKNGALDRILSVSTGSEKRYCQERSCGLLAHTPRGDFTTARRIYGARVSKLGTLYNPVSFTGGYAIHGSPSVPAIPASHGCVRISMEASTWFIREVPLGIPVHIVQTPTPAITVGTPVTTTVPTTTPAPTTAPPTTVPPTTVQPTTVAPEPTTLPVPTTP